MNGLIMAIVFYDHLADFLYCSSAYRNGRHFCADYVQ